MGRSRPARTPAAPLPVIATPVYMGRSWTGSNTNLRKASCISTFGSPTRLSFAGGLRRACDFSAYSLWDNDTVTELSVIPPQKEGVRLDEGHDALSNRKVSIVGCGSIGSKVKLFRGRNDKQLRVFIWTANKIVALKKSPRYFSGNR